jgi:hypothetical protein
MTRADSVYANPKHVCKNPNSRPELAGHRRRREAGRYFPGDRQAPEGRPRRNRSPLRFLDETENHMELEPNGEELDASWPESGRKAEHPLEDDEGDTPPKMTGMPNGASASLSVTPASTAALMGPTRPAIRTTSARGTAAIGRTSTTARAGRRR